MKPIRILLADDHGIVREGVRALIDVQADMIVVAEAESGARVPALVEQHMPDIAILDIEMGGMTGIEVTQALQQSAPETRVIVLSIHEEEAFIRLVRNAGASGYVTKRSVGSDLVRAIRTVHRTGSDQGDVPAPAHAPSERRKTDPLLSLSRREIEVLELVARGYTNDEVGAQLRISPKTVATYRSRLSQKGLRSRVEIVDYALHAGLLTARDRGDDT